MKKIRQKKNCQIESLIKILSGEWTIHIICTLGKERTLRYGELKRKIIGVSSKVLTERLRLLEEKHIVTRLESQSAPRKVSYELTQQGHLLDATLRQMEEVAAYWS
jgi:DNA-binding HxlR family transcriptional regulator